MNPDIVRWNDKYSAAAEAAFAQPDDLLAAHQGLLIRNARVLDLACGAGANAIFAARRGCRVVGIDASYEGLRIAARRARKEGVALALVNADLEFWRPLPHRFDVVMVFRYLDRALFHALPSIIRPGGSVIYKTFNCNFMQQKPDMNPDYLLKPGELKGFFPGWEEIASNDEVDNSEVFSWWIGRTPAA